MVDFDRKRKLGARRAGLLCLPAGVFRWKDASPGMAEIERYLSRAMHDERATVALSEDPDDDPPARYKLSAEITGLTLDACQKKWGLASTLSKSGHPLTGKAHIEIVWSVIERRTRKIVRSQTDRADYVLGEAVEDAADALIQGVLLGGRKFAATL